MDITGLCIRVRGFKTSLLALKRLQCKGYMKFLEAGKGREWTMAHISQEEVALLASSFTLVEGIVDF